tara:strand:+ start:1352 stop:1807 length:456 start_codon:yes stop_codon:yes gene_type:complete
MKNVLTRDMASALMIFCIGLAATLYAWTHYKLGNFRAPGPGLFPVVIAGLLTLVGLGLTVQALVQKVQTEKPDFEFRPFVVIMIAIIAFAMIFPVAGVLPAVFALTFISCFADTPLDTKGKIAVSCVVAVIAVVLFRLILGVRLPVLTGVW